LLEQGEECFFDRTLGGAMQNWLEIERANRMDTTHSLELV
jgi:hypothetical protein